MQPALRVFAETDPSFDYYGVLTSDLLHEWESNGVIKRVFIHLLRLVAGSVNGKALLEELNTR